MSLEVGKQLRDLTFRMKRSHKPFTFGNILANEETVDKSIQRLQSSISYNRNRKGNNPNNIPVESSAMLSCMNFPSNIAISSERRHRTGKKMDRNSSPLPNISVQKPSKEYSLKKPKESIGSSSDEEPKTTKTTNKNTKSSLIDLEDLRPYDVLCGRDKATFNNIGNRRFRYSISLNIPRYDAARTKAEKAAVIKFICDLFRDEVGVRFLKKHESGDGYIELNGSEARKKVGHALRDMSVARQQLNQKRRSSMIQSEHLRKRISISSSINSNDAPSRPEFDSNLLEPLPIGEQQQNQKVQPRYEQNRSNPFHLNMNVAEAPSYSHNQAQANNTQQNFYQKQQQNQDEELLQQQQEQVQQNDLQQTLLRLQQQQLQLEQERLRLLRQQERQQQLQEQQKQIRLQRHLQQQQQQLHQLQQQQQQQQQRQQEQQNQFYQDDGSNEHDVLSTMPFHRIRRPR